jgi:hypothetical protein
MLSLVLHAFGKVHYCSSGSGEVGQYPNFACTTKDNSEVTEDDNSISIKTCITWRKLLKCTEVVGISNKHRMLRTEYKQKTLCHIISLQMIDTVNSRFIIKINVN